MTVTTNRGETFKVNWAWATSDERLMIELPSTERIADIAECFDGLTKVERKSEYEGDATYIGYDVLTSVIKDTEKGTILLSMKRSVKRNG
jgi:hypothetical protein